MPLKSYVLDIMDGHRRGRSLLRALSYLYRMGVALRNQLYDKRLLKAQASMVPVISIGNIVAGGTGKTPLVKFLAEELLSTFRVAILSRGYRSTAEKKGQTLQVTPTTDVRICGDEPYWMAQRLPKAQVWIGKNRLKSAECAHAHQAQIIILDDGMQHRRLQRDFEVVVIDGEDPFGKGFFLPRGLLRDSPRQLKRADLIVVMEPKSEEEITHKLRRYTAAPLVFVRMRTEVDLKGKRVAVFCAIGRPSRFLQTIRAAGGEVIATFFKSDHDPFHAEELHPFAKRSAADVLVCTEKDFVKLPPNFHTLLPLIVLPSQLEIFKGQKAWEQLLTKIKSRVLS